MYYAYSMFLNNIRWWWSRWWWWCCSMYIIGSK